jgi:hypothetical protein
VGKKPNGKWQIILMPTKNLVSICSIPHACAYSGLSLLKSLILSSRRRLRANLIMAGAAFVWLIGVASGEAASMDAGPQMSTARMNHYAVPLPDGRVALLGGHGTGFVSLNSIDIWNPASNSFTSAALPFVYDGGSLVHLSDGNYLLAGGAADDGVAPGYNTAQILNATTATAASTGTVMVRPRMQCNGTQLTGGAVLIVGGWYDSASATYGEIYDPASKEFSATGPLNTPRSMPYVFPTADGKAVVVGGLSVYGDSNVSSIELYDPVANSFSVLAASAIAGEPDWIYGYGWNALDSEQCKTADGRYVFLMSRTVNSQTEYALGVFDPAAKQFSKLALTPGFGNGYWVWPPVVDATNNRALFLVGANQNGGANLTFRVFQVDLATGQALALSDWLSVTNYYPGSAGITLLGDGRLFVTGGTASVDYNFNFNPVPNTFFLSGLTPPPQIQSLGVSGGLVTLTLSGGVGVTYEIQSIPALGTSANWQTLGSLTLTNSVQTWSDPAPATNFSRFYRLQGP